MKHSHHLAVKLAEFLGMLQPADISPELNSLQKKFQRPIGKTRVKMIKNKMKMMRPIFLQQ